MHSTHLLQASCSRLNSASPSGHQHCRQSNERKNRSSRKNTIQVQGQIEKKNIRNNIAT